MEIKDRFVRLNKNELRFLADYLKTRINDFTKLKPRFHADVSDLALEELIELYEKLIRKV